MPNTQQDPKKDDSKKKDHHHCGCCGPTGFEFPEEMMTPEIKALKETMSPEEFEKIIIGMMK
jgi:hypothetical protein